MQHKKAKVLVVDDERANVHALSSILTDSYKVSVALSAVQTLELLNDSADLPAIILLDVMMPEINGLELCQKIKKDRALAHIPIIFVSTLTDPLDKVAGLQAGAVDFISKPYNAQEVLARVHAHLNIAQKQQALAQENHQLQHINSQLTYSTHTLVLNEHTLKLKYKECSAELTRLEFRLFQLLFNRPDRVYSRAEILDLAYPDMRDISDRTIDAHVKNIRKKIKKLGIEEPILESVYGAGYKYNPLNTSPKRH